MIPEPVTRYRNWVLESSVKTRLLLLGGLFALFWVAGSIAGFANAALPALLVRLIYWSILVFMLYTLYALVRSVIPRFGTPPDAELGG